MPAAPLYPSGGEVELPGLSLAWRAGGKGVPIGGREGKWFVWRGLRVVGKVAEACEWGFGGGVILWGWGRKVLKGWRLVGGRRGPRFRASGGLAAKRFSEEHTSELQSLRH